MRETLDVGKSGLEFREYFENTFGYVLRSQASWDVVSVPVRTSYISDGTGSEHDLSSL
jgi:hypothetical protein